MCPFVLLLCFCFLPNVAARVTNHSSFPWTKGFPSHGAFGAKMQKSRANGNELITSAPELSDYYITWLNSHPLFIAHTFLHTPHRFSREKWWCYPEQQCRIKSTFDLDQGGDGGKTFYFRKLTFKFSKIEAFITNFFFFSLFLSYPQCSSGPPPSFCLKARCRVVIFVTG